MLFGTQTISSPRLLLPPRRFDVLLRRLRVLEARTEALRLRFERPDAELLRVLRFELLRPVAFVLRRLELALRFEDLVPVAREEERFAEVRDAAPRPEARPELLERELRLFAEVLRRRP